MRYIVAEYTEIAHVIDEDGEDLGWLPSMCGLTGVRANWKRPAIPEKYGAIRLMAHLRWWVDTLPEGKRVCKNCAHLVKKKFG